MKKFDKNHYYVNWIDGMKINKSHFIDSDNANIALISKVTSILVNSNHYGLLPIVNNQKIKESISLSLNAQNSSSINIIKCKAVTIGGYYIEISSETNLLLGKSGKFDNISADLNSISDKSQPYYIVLNIDPFAKIPVGEPDNNEEPPRHPYAICNYTLNAVKETELLSDTLGNRYLIVGKIYFSDNKPEIDLNYIPPSYSIQSHEDLIFIYTQLGVFFNSLEKYSLQILQKILQKKQSNELAHMVQSITQNVWQYISSIIPEYEIEDRTASPIKIVVKLITLSRILKNSMDVYIGTGKEELVNYLMDWTDTTQGEFEALLADMINLQYKHYDINLSLNLIAKFSKVTLGLFKKLDELDYIGKKADSNIFVKEQVVVKEDIKQRRSFLLD